MEENDRHLPEHVIIKNILPWLTVKSLCRFKSVSKKRYSSISSPTFLLKYTQLPLFPHLSSALDCLIIQIGKRYYLYHCDPNDDNVEQLATYSNPNSLIELHVDFNIIQSIYLVGSCNGLVCLGDIDGKFFILWNPFIQQFKKWYVPEYKDLNFNVGLPYDVSWGFGYVSSQDDHKVVCMMSEVDVVHVFSMRAKCWRRIEFSFEDEFLARKGRLVGERLYWGVSFIPENESRRNKIYVFDLAQERLELLSDDFGMHHGLTVMGGYLALCMCTSECEKGHVIKRICIVRSRENVVYDCPCELNLVHNWDVIGFTKTGKMFGANNHQQSLVLVDETSMKTLVTFDGNVGHASIEGYVPSQISPSPAEVIDAVGQDA